MQLQGLPAAAAVLNGNYKIGQKIAFLTFTSHKEKKKIEVLFIYRKTVHNV
jgi:hypothetical protein